MRGSSGTRQRQKEPGPQQSLRTMSWVIGTSFFGHFASRFFPGFGFLNMRSAFMKKRFLSMSSPMPLICSSSLRAAHQQHVISLLIFAQAAELRTLGP